MEVIPAIDIRDGKCVRLYQGDYARETVYSEQPLRMAKHWVEQGATRLHVVDLDGARSGAPANIEVTAEIASSVDIPVQLGGAIRTLENVREAVSLGMSRVIIGTAALEDPDLVGAACREVGPERVLVAIDARDGYVTVQGWTRGSRVSAAELLHRITESGVERFIYTDVSRDGTLTEPNYQAVAAMAAETPLHMLVAGGIASIDHLARLSQMNVEGAIIGTAIYTGDIDLSEAIGAVGGSPLATS